MATAPAKAPNPPTSEIGGIGGIGAGPKGWASYMQEGERVPELRWPQSVTWYEWMLADSQVDSLYTATALPLVDYVWWIEPGDADETAAQALADDLGLPYEAPDPSAPYEPPGAGVFGFNFLSHLEEALEALLYGHYYFEIVGQTDVGGDGLWHLEKLAPRAPATIEMFQVAPKGDLLAIQQKGTILVNRGGISMAGQPPPIPASVLVPYVWREDARNRHIGRSMLRSLYKHWLVKDVLIRVDAINHERAGGVPWVKTDSTFQGYDLKELQEVAAAFRVGEDGGAALPPGAELMLARIGGTDVIASIRYHDESMARVWQSMVIQLGQTSTGSRALGGTFQDLQSFARRAIGRWFATRFREDLIEKWWAWNVGTGPGGRPLPHPVLACRPPLPDESAAQTKADAAPTISPELGGGGAPPPDPPVAAAGNPSPRARGGAAGPRASAPSLPDRPLRREPNAAEVRAAVDFASIDAHYEQGASALEKFWLGSVIPQQVTAVGDAIVFTKTGEKRQRVTRLDMSKLQVPVVGAPELAEMMLPAVKQGASGAVEEALAQGVPITMPSDAQLAKLVTDHAQAVAQMAADGLSLAAQRKAVQVTGGRTAKQIAEATTSYLSGLKHQWTVDQLHGAVQMAVNAGRFAVMDKVDAPASFVASELLDANTCDPCAGVDGTEFATLEEAMAEYPSGGYVDCDGGPRCRGFAVAVYDEL